MENYIASLPDDIGGMIEGLLPADKKVCYLLESACVKSPGFGTEGTHLRRKHIVAFKITHAGDPPGTVPYVSDPFDAKKTRIAAIQQLFISGDDFYAVIHGYEECSDALAASCKGFETYSPRVIRPADEGVLVVPVATLAWRADADPLNNDNKHIPDVEYAFVGYPSILLKPFPHPDRP